MSYHSPPGAAGPPSGYPQVPPSPASLRGLAKALTVLLLVIAALLLGNAAALFYRASLLSGAAAGRSYRTARADLADAVIGSTEFVYLWTMIATAVVFIVWQYRHARNARLLGAGGLGPGWAIGGWFIPLGNLVLPAVQIFQSSRGADTEAPRRGYQRGSAVVVWWAVAFGLGNALVGGAVSLWPESLATTADLAAAAASDNLEGVAGLLLIGAAVLAVVMVNTLSRRQEAALVRRTHSVGPPTVAPAGWPEAPWTRPSALPPPQPPPGPHREDPPADQWRSPS